MWLMIILNIPKNQGFTFSVEDTIVEKTQGGGVQCSINPEPFKG